MLIALDSNNKRVCAFDVDKYNSKGDILKYYCPECGEELILRKGSVYQHHFSHKGDKSECRLREYGGESNIHNFMKYKIRKIIEEDNDVIESEIEYPIGQRIADYYCTLKDNKGKVKRVAVEIVHKHENIKDFIDKCEDYYNEDVYCIWIFNINRFTYKSVKKSVSNVGLNEIVSNNKEEFLEHVHVNEIMKNAHTLHFGQIYALDAIEEMVYSVHIESLYSSNPNKTFVTKLVDSFDIMFAKPKKPDDFLDYHRKVAGPYVEKYWKNRPYDYKFKRSKNKTEDDFFVLEEKNNQKKLKKEFYNYKSEDLGYYGKYQIVYVNGAIIIKDYRKDYYYKCKLTSKENVLNFLRSRRITIPKKDDLFEKLNYIVVLSDDEGVSVIVDPDVDKVVNKKDSPEEFDDFINCFNQNNDEYISDEEYFELKKHSSKDRDLKIIPMEDKYYLIEFFDDKKYLHGVYDSWDEADKQVWS